jgi:hypothetical protein
MVSAIKQGSFACGLGCSRLPSARSRPVERVESALTWDPVGGRHRQSRQKLQRSAAEIPASESLTIDAQASQLKWRTVVFSRQRREVSEFLGTDAPQLSIGRVALFGEAASALGRELQPGELGGWVGWGGVGWALCGGAASLAGGAARTAPRPVYVLALGPERLQFSPRHGALAAANRRRRHLPPPPPPTPPPR